MSNNQGSRGWLVVFAIFIAVGLVLGGGAFRSHQITEELRLQQADAQASAPRFSDYGSMTSGDSGFATRNALRREVFQADEATRRWLDALSIYAVLFAALLAIAAVVHLARGIRDEAVRKAEANREAGVEPLSMRLARAAGEIKRAIPRQPTLAGGRLSTADELRKWTTLRDEGLVSEEEFLKMREKLLG